VTKLLTYEEVRDRYGLRSTRTVRRWVEAGELPAVHLTTRTVRFREEDVEALIASRTDRKVEAAR
jgi:excisionase family DNA binding protein